MNPRTSPPRNSEEAPTRRSESIARCLAHLLESARQQSGIGNEQIQSELRLPVVALGHIQSGEFDALGPEIYARGFVFGYARIVEAPLSEVESLWAELHHMPEQVPLVSHVPQRPDWQIGAQHAATVVIVLGVLVGPILWLHSQGAFQQWFGPDEQVVVAPVSGEFPAEFVASVDSGPAAPEPAPVLEVPEDPEDPASAPVTASIASLPSVVPVESESNEDPEAAPAALVLEIYFRDDCWVEVSSGEGDRLEYNLVRANSRRRYESNGSLSVFLGNAEAVTVAVNGEFLDIAPYRRRNLARFEVDVPDPENAE
ncbi:MAG: helix-turn-helix domain-containing protein [Gammaproteobacteria bacterium]|nr:MAG: helix-turn-helix domain-containing protein [Gammaproteobacteria bacterium]